MGALTVWLIAPILVSMHSCLLVVRFFVEYGVNPVRYYSRGGIGRMDSSLFLALVSILIRNSSIITVSIIDTKEIEIGIPIIRSVIFDIDLL